MLNLRAGICGSAWTGGLLLYHHPPVELPHSRRKQLKVQTLNWHYYTSSLQELHFGKSALLSHGVNEVTHLLHICSSPKASLQQTITLTHCVMLPLLQKQWYSIKDNSLQHRAELSEQSAKSPKRSNIWFNVSLSMWWHRKDVCCRFYWNAPPQINLIRLHDITSLSFHSWSSKNWL